MGRSQGIGTLCSQSLILTQHPREGAEVAPKFEPAFISLSKESNSAVQICFGMRTRETLPGGVWLPAGALG